MRQKGTELGGLAAWTDSVSKATSFGKSILEKTSVAGGKTALEDSARQEMVN
jgi:hypothetical protein